MRGLSALVTGASRGIGAAIAQRLREAGATVLAPARGEMDLLSNESIDAYLASLREPVDILVNNAGINRLGTSAEISPEDVRDMMQVNLLAPFRLVAGLVPAMKARRFGRIVNISSVFGGPVTRNRRVVYSVTKSGINGLTRALAIELAPFGILVNGVAPGYIDTELTRQNNSEEELARIRAGIPLGRLAAPAEIAEVVAFLCSRQNSYLTAQTILVDGGFTCT